MLPAQRRLETDNFAIDTHQRLVVEHKLVALERRTKIMIERATFAQLLIHVGLEETDGAAPFGLGAVECGVGVGEQGSLVDAVARIHRDADTHADMQALAVHVERFARGRQHAFRKPVGARRQLVVRDDKRELVATDAREECAVRDRRQSLGDLSQQFVANCVAEHVVDVLETIEVDAKYGELLFGFFAAFERLREMHVERRAIGRDPSADRDAPDARCELPLPSAR